MKHTAQSDQRGGAQIERLLARLGAAARELDAAVLPGEVASQRRAVAQLFDITMIALYAAGRLPREATLRRVLAACGGGAARLVPLEWGRVHFVHQFYTREFVSALATHILATGLAPVLEVGSGQGELARWLRRHGVPVIATDDGSWLDGRLSWPRGVPEGVEPLSYSAALARYRPQLVLCSWMPQGEDWTPAFRACTAVREYLLIGEGPGGFTGTAASFAPVAPWQETSLEAIARLGIIRHPDRASRSAVYSFYRGP